MIRRQFAYFPRKLLLKAALIIFSAIVVSCSEAPATPATRQEITPLTPPERVGLSDSAVALIDILDAAANESNYEPNVFFIQGNDETLIADVIEGRLAAALVYSIPTEATLWFNPVALDGLTVIGNQNNPLDELSLDIVRSIFQGEIGNWSQVGGDDLPISVYVREAGSGVQETFKTKVPGDGTILSSAIVAPGHEPMISSVQHEEGAIGLSMMSSSEVVKSFDISGIPANQEETSKQHYPLSTPLYFVSNLEPQGELRAFLSWLQSTEGQSFLGEKYGRIR